MLYEIKDGSVSLGGETVLSHFNFGIRSNEKIAIVGPNGVGKSTLLRLIAGELSLDRDDKRGGKIHAARSLVVGYLPQIVEEKDCTVENLIMEACPCEDLWDRERFLYEQEYDRIFTAMGFAKEDKTKKVGEFSGGQQVRIALIRLMLLKPDILLLDEPTNHLDQEMTQWLEEWIAAYEKAVVYVSHDRYFMDETADVVYEVKGGALHRYPGNYSAYVEQRQKQAVLLKKEWEGQQAEIERLNALIKKFHNKPRKASFARSRQKILDRMEVMEKPESAVIRPDFGELVPERISGKKVLSVEKLQIGYDKEKPLLELNLEIRRGQRIGIIGANGVGKSSFLKTLAGQLAPVSGHFLEGQNVEMAYYDQHIVMEEEALPALEHFHKRFPLLSQKDARAILSRWGLKGKEAASPVSALSGGERSRLRFAELFQSCPNFLILDEPGNHLDMAAKEVLESALRAYKGTLLFVSHDRYFMDQVATGLLIFEEGNASYYPFGYSHYKKRGKTKSGQIAGEEMAMLESYRKVPDKERGMLREFSTDQLYVDWKLSLFDREKEPLERKLLGLREHLDILQAKLEAVEWKQAGFLSEEEWLQLAGCLEEEAPWEKSGEAWEVELLEKLGKEIEEEEEALEAVWGQLTELCISLEEQLQEDEG